MPQTPVSVMIELTSRCNLRCSYCLHFDSATEHCKDLPTNKWLQFLEELQSLSVFKVTFTGGEPFIRPDFIDICRKAAECNLRYNILSNGILITHEKAKAIADIGRCSIVQISLDGIGEVNDRGRGKGAFDGAVRGIRILQEHGFHVFPRVTISHHNLGHLEETADYIVNELGISQFGTNWASVGEGNAKDPANVELNIREYAEAIREHQRVLAKYPDCIVKQIGPLGSLLRWKSMLEHVRDDKPRFRGGCHSTCGMVFTELTVRPDGGILACGSYPDQVMGYVNQDSLKDIWLNGEFVNELRGLRCKPLSDYEYCSSCKYRPWCAGSCPAVALQYNTDGETSAGGNICLRKFLEVEPDFDFGLE